MINKKRLLVFGSVFKNYLKVLFYDLGAKIFGLLTTIFVIRFLSVTEYSQFTVFNSISAMLLGILGNGLSLAYLRYSVEMRSRGSDANGLFFTLMLLLLPFFISLTVLLDIVPTFLNTSKHLLAIAVFYGLVLSITQLNQSYFQALELYDKAGMIHNIKNIIVFVYVGALACLVHDGLLEYILVGFIVSVLIGASTGLVFIWKQGERFHVSDKSVLKKMVQESGWLIVYSFILNLFSHLDVLMLSVLADKPELVQYGVAHRYYGIALSFLPAILTILRVKTSHKEIVDDIHRQQELTRTWIKNAAPISGLLTVAGIITSWLVFPILNGELYNAAIPIFNILMIGVGFSYITAPNMGVMMATRQHKLLCLIAFGSFCINFLGNYIFIPHYGVYAAAVSTVVSQAFLNGVCTLKVLYR